MPRRVLLLLPRSSYRARAYLSAVRGLGAEPIVGSDHTPALPGPGHWQLPLADPAAAAAQIATRARSVRLDAVLGTDEATAEIAALAAQRLGLRHNLPDAVATAHDKLRFRERVAARGLPGPRFLALPMSPEPAARLLAGGYPWVLKPRDLSASRGVIRVDRPGEVPAALARITRLIESTRAQGMGGARADTLLAESYITGHEVALEGIVEGGRLLPLALFDKPDAPSGPHFEETLYLTPSRLPEATQRDCTRSGQALVEALGLETGALHLELRANADGVWPLELAARPIGGQCADIVRLADGSSLETTLLRQALGETVAPLAREAAAVGVLMLPVPSAGRLNRVRGTGRARAVALIEEVVISAPSGAHLAPAPEGGQYLGFVFARGPEPAAVEAALRCAQAALVVEMAEPDQQEPGTAVGRRDIE